MNSVERYQVIIAPAALDAIAQTVRYVRDEIGGASAADRLFKQVFGAIAKLDRFPLRRRLIEAEPLRSAGVRRLNIGKYSVFYMVDKASNQVKVFAFFYGTPSLARLRKAFQGISAAD